MKPMINRIFEGGCRTIGGVSLIGEVVSLFSGDTLKQAGFMCATAAAWAAHFAWDYQKKRREARADERRLKDEDQTSARRNRLLNELERKVRASLKAGEHVEPLLLHLLTDRDIAAEPKGGDE